MCEKTPRLVKLPNISIIYKIHWIYMLKVRLLKLILECYILIRDSLCIFFFVLVKLGKIKLLIIK